MATTGMIQRHPYDRGGDTSAIHRPTSHLIKIGFDARALLTPAQAKEKKGKIPGKLPGFAIFRNTDNPGGYGRLPEHEVMTALGYPLENLAKAMRSGMNATPGELLPLELMIAIPRNAARTAAGGWTFPGVLASQYQCYDKAGLFCFGDGVSASRKQGDGTRSEIACVPKGTMATDAQCCKFSVSGACKVRMKFTCQLITPDGKFVSRLGDMARFAIESTSDYSLIDIHDALVDAANRLDGRIGGLRGYLIYSVQERRRADGVGKAPAISLVLDEEQIERRITGESERIAAQMEAAAEEIHDPESAEPTRPPSAPDSVPAAVAASPAPSPEREDGEVEGANANAPDDAAPQPIDLDAVADDELVTLLRSYVDWLASRSGASPDEVAAANIWFNQAGQRYDVTRFKETWAWFTAEVATRDKRSAKLREIAERVTADEAWSEFWAEAVAL
jgi:hypothetical protein